MRDFISIRLSFVICLLTCRCVSPRRFLRACRMKPQRRCITESGIRRLKMCFTSQNSLCASNETAGTAYCRIGRSLLSESALRTISWRCWITILTSFDSSPGISTRYSSDTKWSLYDSGLFLRFLESGNDTFEITAGCGMIVNSNHAQICYASAVNRWSVKNYKPLIVAALKDKSNCGAPVGRCAVDAFGGRLRRPERPHNRPQQSESKHFIDVSEENEAFWNSPRAQALESLTIGSRMSYGAVVLAPDGSVQASRPRFHELAGEMNSPAAGIIRRQICQTTVRCGADDRAKRSSASRYRTVRNRRCRGFPRSGSDGLTWES